MRQHSLLRCLPFIELEENSLLTNAGYLALGCELTKLPLGTASPEKLTARHEQLITAINLLPNGCILHFQDCYIKNPNPAPTATPGNDSPGNSREQRFERSYCFLIRCPVDKFSYTPFESLLKPRLAPDYVVDPDKRAAFLAAANQFFQSLTAAGLEARPLSGEELAGTAQSTGPLERYMTQNPGHLAPYLEDVHFHKTGVTVGRKQLLFYTLADAAQLPSVCTTHRRYEPYSTTTTDYRTGFATPVLWK